MEQLHPGADLPLAAAGRRAARRDGPVGVEAAEVVDSEQIVDAQRVPHPLDPPSIAGLAVVGPVVQRIAPELAVGGKVIRRAAGHTGKAAVGVQLEQRAAHPSVHGVRRDVDGDIAEDLDALFVGVGFDLFPLGRELVLQELPEADLFLVFGAEALQRTAVPQTVLAGPLGPALHPVGGLERHVQGVILQPVLIFEGEGVVSIRVVAGTAVQPFPLLAPCGVSGPQDLVAAGVQRAVIHCQRVFAPRLGLELGRRQQPFGLEGIEVDEIGVARKGGAALVGAVAVAGGAQRQDLPDLLARSGEKINELFSFLSEAANSIRAGQAGHRHQDSTFTHDVPSSFRSDFGYFLS